MRNILLSLMTAMCAVIHCYSQSVPTGIQYQAVARNASGEVLPNRSLTLRIKLEGAPAKGSITYYSEEHEVTTNQLGLFTLVVGNGIKAVGVFENIPWSSEDIWMAVSLRDMCSEDKCFDFTAVSESRLLAVPYAF